MTVSQLLRNTTSVELELWRVYFRERDWQRKQAEEERRLEHWVNEG